MDKKRGVLLIFCAAAVSFLLCLTLYTFDNKYTHGATQPISGVLLLSEEDLAANPVRYLTREWEFYPGVLLSPGETEGVYRRYVDIGRTDYFSQGSGTYRLRMVLPAERRFYAIELPEVFSACRLYIDDWACLTLGIPEEEHYQEGIASRLVTFSAAGTVELLLAVSDHSGQYSGLVYPPAFGDPVAVTAVRETRFIIHGVVVLLALLALCFSVGFALKGQRTRGILMALICLCFAFATGYPIYHAGFVTSYLPWYALELVSLYALWLLAILLFSNLYGVSPLWQLTLAAPCALGVVAALLRSLTAPIWGHEMLALFSLLSSALKYYAALCLLALSVWAILRGTRCAKLLLCGSLGLAVCLICDRLLPLYEPIYGGWLGEVGGGLLVISLVLIFWQDSLSAYRFRLSYQESFFQLERQLSFQKEHYRQMSEQIAHSRESAHDLRHHTSVLRTLATRGESAEIVRYLDTYQPHLLESAVTTYCDHLAADAVLCHYSNAAAALGVDCDIHLPLPRDFSFPSDELCVMLSNLLENALEALARQTDGPRTLYLRGGVLDGDLALIVNNSFDGATHMQAEHFLSRKREEGFGLGIRSVERIVETHGGLSSFTAEGSHFQVSLLLPLPRED